MPDAPLPLSAADCDRFVTDGYAILRGALDADAVRECLDRIRLASGLDRDVPATWRSEVAGNLGERGINAALGDLFSPRLQAACRQLCGENVTCHGFTPIIRLPVTPPPDEPPVFRPMGRHIDGVRAGLTLYPAMRYLVALVYLHDTDACGGATSLHPGAHRQVFEYAYLRDIDLSGDWKAQGSASAPDLDYPPAIPFVGAAGDALLFHYLMPHGGSQNYAARPRIALNGVARPVTPYQPRSGPPAADWTPIDRSLRTDTLPAPDRRVS